MTTKQLRAIDYARISDGEDDGKSVPTIPVQHAMNQVLIEREGYVSVAVLEDINISAARDSKGKLKVRPGFNRALQMVADGEADVIVARDSTRLSRDEATTQRLLNTGWEAGALLHYVEGGRVDPSEPEVRFTEGVKGGAGALSVAQNRKHQIDRNRARVTQGLPLEGKRGFGHAADRITPLEPEATMVREGFEHIAQGGSLYQLAKAWNASGIGTIVGENRERGRWSVQGVKRVLTAPRCAGILVYQGEEQPQSLIEPLVDRALFDQVQSILSDPARDITRGRKATVGLLSGIAWCTCGARMSTTTGAVRDGGVPLYVCRAVRQGNQDKTVKHSTIHRDIVDGRVPAAVFGALVTRAGTSTEPAVLGPLMARKSDLERQRIQAQELALMPGANMAHVGKVLAQLAGDIDVLETQIREARMSASDRVQQLARRIGYAFVTAVEAGEVEPEREHDVLDAVRAEVFDPEWAAMPLEEQRNLVRDLLTITIKPIGRGGAPDPSRVVIEPR